MHSRSPSTSAYERMNPGQQQHVGGAMTSDLVDEGMDADLDNVSKRAGLGGLTMAAAYHHGRDVFPHNPARKVHFLEGGTVFFQPDSSRYQGRALQPLVSALAQKTDVLADL